MCMSKHTFKIHITYSRNKLQFESLSSSKQQVDCRKMTDLACAALILALAVKKRKNKTGKRKRVWCKELKKPNKFGITKLLKEMEVSSVADINTFGSMNKTNLLHLLEQIKPMINKKNTLMRESIPPSVRLSITLRCLTSGETFEELKILSGIAAQTIGRIVMETCMAIITVLKDNIKLPANEDEWKKEAKLFEELWDFPHCVGALDGRHVNITKPPGSGSLYFNHNRNFSIILTALTNANYEFLKVNVGLNGGASDASIIRESKLYEKFQENERGFPKPEPITESGVALPYVFVADDAFPLTENIMKPYIHNSLEKEEIIFNYRLSRARRVAENVFEVLASRFRVLQRTIHLDPEKVSTIVLACCHLHNYICQSKSKEYFKNDLNVEETQNAKWRSEKNLDSIRPTQVRNYTNEAKLTRNAFCTYFNSEGVVPWQYTIIDNVSTK